MNRDIESSKIDAPVGYATIGNLGVVCFAIVLPTFVTLVYFQLLAGDASGLQQVAFGIGKVAQFLLPLVWVLLADKIFWQNQKNSFPFLSSDTDSEGQPKSTKSGNGLVFGFVFGAAVVLLMLAFYKIMILGQPPEADLVELVKQKVSNFGIDSPIKFLGLGLFYALIHSFLEEYYWRWFVFGYLKKIMTFWPAAILSSLGFMAHHVVLMAFFFGWDSPLTYLISASIAVGGMVWAVLFNRTKSLMSPWLSHMLVDAGIFGLGYWLVRDTFV